MKTPVPDPLRVVDLEVDPFAATAAGKDERVEAHGLLATKSWRGWFGESMFGLSNLPGFLGSRLRVTMSWETLLEAQNSVMRWAR